MVRRISKKDLEEVAEYIKEEKKRRANNEFRTQHENIWKTVDRQIAMRPEEWTQRAPEEQWESNIELGSLADASEIIADDVMRIAFPSDRDWFRPHINTTQDLEMSETGERKLDIELQKRRDNIYKSLLTQQHQDFGLKHRVKLSVKEALHHGSFVAVVEWRSQKQFFGSSVKEISAPVWIPHSMWNCYPDDSPYVIGTNVTYEGSMIIETEVPLKVAMKQNWMNLDKIREKESQDDPNIKLLYYYGDIYIRRSSGSDIYAPNQKVIVYEDHVLYSETNETSSCPIIYSGYERDDIRDPYYSSPLVKRSPTHKLATHCANKYVEAIDLRTKPPIGYDANEPAFRNEGGPIIAPGELFPLRSGGQLKTLDVADPTWALQGLQLFKAEVEEGVGVDAVRKGASGNVEQTAYEISKLDQKSEIRTIDFVNTLETQGLKTFLYYQHDLNQSYLEPYGFFNTELNTPDFMTATKADINKWAKEVHFEVVGSKGVLGEERRRQGTLEVTGFFGSSQLFGPHLNVKEIMQDAYRDVGVKDPERYLNFDEGNPEADAIAQKAEQALAMVQQELQKAQQQLAELPLIQERHAAEKAKLVNEKATMAAENKLLEEQLQLVIKRDQAEKQLLGTREKIINELKAAEEKMMKGVQAERQQTEKVGKAVTDQTNQQAQQLSELLREERTMVAEMLQYLNRDREDRAARQERIRDFVSKNGTPETQEFLNGI